MLLCCRYGYVTPADVPDLIDLHIGKGEIIEKLWRYVILLPYVTCHLDIHEFFFLGGGVLFML